MQPVFKCDFCQFMGTEGEVRAHELKCFDNYMRKSCYTCQHRGEVNFKNGLLNYKCNKCVPIPDGTILEFCESYERKLKPDSPLSDTVRSFFGGNF